MMTLFRSVNPVQKPPSNRNKVEKIIGFKVLENLDFHI